MGWLLLQRVAFLARPSCLTAFPLRICVCIVGAILGHQREVLWQTAWHDGSRGPCQIRCMGGESSGWLRPRQLFTADAHCFVAAQACECYATKAEAEAEYIALVKTIDPSFAPASPSAAPAAAPVGGGVAADAGDMGAEATAATPQQTTRVQADDAAGPMPPRAAVGVVAIDVPK